VLVGDGLTPTKAQFNHYQLFSYSSIMEFNHKIEVVNRKATHSYFFEYTLEAGIVLGGTEIKSIRLGEVNMSDAFCSIDSKGLYVENLHISEYKNGTYNNHKPKRVRRLLVNKRELRKLSEKVKESGYTIIPYRLYISDRGYAKLEIALAKGKKLYDKRETLKEKDDKREMDRFLKPYS
jgi:SsrA-binding protein